RDDLLARAVHQSKRRIQRLVAEVAPRPDVPAVMRKLPERKAVGCLPPPPLALAPEAVGAALVAPPGELRHAVETTAADSPPIPAPLSVAILELRPDGVEAAPAVARCDGRSTAVVPRPVVQPLSPGRYKIQFTAGARLHDLLERLQAL